MRKGNTIRIGIAVSVYITMLLLLAFLHCGCATLRPPEQVVQELAIEIIADELGCYLAMEAPDELSEILPLIKIVADGKADQENLDSIITKLSDLTGVVVSPRMCRHIERLQELFIVKIDIDLQVPFLVQVAASAFVEGAEACGR